jgi:hypothetical protein
MKKQKNQFDMDQIAQVADALLIQQGTSVMKNKIIRVAAEAAGIDSYTVWRTFLLNEYRTDQKGVYDIAPLCSGTVPKIVLDEKDEIVQPTIAEEIAAEVDFEDLDEDDDDYSDLQVEDEEDDEDAEYEELEIEDSAEYDPSYEIMNEIGYAYQESIDADFMGDY